MDESPILPPASPFFSDVHGCKIKHLEQAVVTGEYRFAFGHLTELAIEALDRIGGIDELPDFAWILEIGGQLWPAIAPGFRDFRILPVPFFSKGIQLIKGGLLIYGSVDLFQISHQCLDIFVGDELCTVSDLMYDASLDFCLGEYGGDRFRESRQSVNAGN